MKRLRIEIGFGIGEDKFGAKLTPSDVANAMNAICREASRVCGGYTLTDVAGGWVNTAGRLVEEPGKTLLCFLDMPVISEDHTDRTRRAEWLDVTGKAKGLAAYCKGALEQEAVALSLTVVDFEFV